MQTLNKCETLFVADKEKKIIVMIISQYFVFFVLISLIGWDWETICAINQPNQYKVPKMLEKFQ